MQFDTSSGRLLAACCRLQRMSTVNRPVMSISQTTAATGVVDILFLAADIGEFDQRCSPRRPHSYPDGTIARDLLTPLIPNGLAHYLWTTTKPPMDPFLLLASRTVLCRVFAKRGACSMLTSFKDRRCHFMNIYKQPLGHSQTNLHLRNKVSRFSCTVLALLNQSIVFVRVH